MNALIDIMGRVEIAYATLQRSKRREVLRAASKSTSASTASSAESILQSCLRRRGWMNAWRAGTLTGKRCLQLLEDIRQHGRAWLRREAEALFRHHGSQSNARSHRWGDYLPSELVPLLDRALLPSVSGALSRWFKRAKTFVHELILSGAMAIGGSGAPSQDELDAVERAVQEQNQYFDRFEREALRNPPPELLDVSTQTQLVEPPAMTGREFAARAERYGNSVWQHAQQINTANVRQQGVFTEERRVLGHPKTEHCEDCPPLAAMGWQPVGSLPDIGTTECNGLCLCHFEYRDGPQGKAHVIVPPKQPAIPKLPSTGGPPEKTVKPGPGGGKPPRGDGLPSIEELMEQARQAGATFTPGVEYEEL